MTRYTDEEYNRLISGLRETRDQCDKRIAELLEEQANEEYISSEGDSDSGGIR